MTPPGPHRVIVGEPLPDPPPGRSYRHGVRNHNPYAHHRRYDVPQLRGTFGVDDLDRKPAPVKICAVVDRYPPLQNAGAEWMLHHLFRDSVRRGHSVIVVTATPEAYTLDGVLVVPHRELHDIAPQADVHVGHLMWTREAVETAATYQRPLIYLVHNNAQLWHWKLTGENITIGVWNSRWIGADSGARWPGQGVVIRPPVLIDDYALTRDPWSATYATLVNPSKEKGVDLFYALADRPPARRYLAVEGAYGDQQKPGHQHPNVAWQDQTGNMRDDVYARTRVLLMPSWFESWGRAAVEAMCSGIPVIANPTEGLLEALGTAGIFIDRTDVAGWQQMLSMLDDEDVYRERSAAAYQRASELTLTAHQDFDTWNDVVETCGAINPAVSMSVGPIHHDDAPSAPAPPSQVSSPA